MSGTPIEDIKQLEELTLWHAQTEIAVRELKELFDSGNLSLGEYEELIEDLLEMKGVEADLELEQNKIYAQKAIDALKMVSGLI